MKQKELMRELRSRKDSATSRMKYYSDRNEMDEYHIHAGKREAYIEIAELLKS